MSHLRLLFQFIIRLFGPPAAALGCFCVNTPNHALGLTVGHILAGSSDAIVAASADKPYYEAVKFAGIRIADETKERLRNQRVALICQAN